MKMLMIGVLAWLLAANVNKMNAVIEAADLDCDAGFLGFYNWHCEVEP